MTDTADRIRADLPTIDPTPSPARAPAAHEWVVVGPDGSDDPAVGRGSAERPYRTIAHALALLPAAGRGVLVLPGVYAEPGLVTPADGTAARPLWIRGVAGDPAAGEPRRPRVIGTGSASTVLTVNRSHWVVDGLELDGRGENRRGVAVGAPGVAAAQGVALHDLEVHGMSGAQAVRIVNARDVVVRRCLVRDNWRADSAGRRDDAHGINVLQDSDRILIEGNVLRGNSGDSVQVAHANEPHVPTAADGAVPQNVTIAGNDCSADGENAVDLKSCRRVTVVGNVLHEYLSQAGRPGEAAAIVVHYDARAVLVCGNDIRDCRVGASIEDLGSPADPNRAIGPVVVRDNRFVTLRAGADPAGTAVGVRASQVAGVDVAGVVVPHAVEIYDNTFGDIDGTAVSLGSNGSPPIVSPLVANNLFESVTTAVAISPAGISGRAPGDPTCAGSPIRSSLTSDHNQFRAPGPATFRSAGSTVAVAAWQACYDTSSCIDL